jgi:UDP-N-acetyl-D-glucosamine dehydrogenase
VLILGVAYKPDVDDVRESPSLLLIELLQDAGASVDYHDPHVPGLEPGFDMVSVELNGEALAACDCVIIATAHSCFDAQQILCHAPLIVDTRNFLGGLDDPDGKIVRA